MGLSECEEKGRVMHRFFADAAAVRGGSIFIEWNGSKENPNCDVFMTGPAEYVFEAELK